MLNKQNKKTNKKHTRKVNKEVKNMLKTNTKEFLNAIDKVTKTKGNYDTFTICMENNRLAIIGKHLGDISHETTAYINDFSGTLENRIAMDFDTSFKNVIKRFKDEIEISVNDSDIVFQDGKKSIRKKIVKAENDLNIGEVIGNIDIDDPVFTKELLKHEKFVSENKARPMLQYAYIENSNIWSTNSYYSCHTALNNVRFDNSVYIHGMIIKLIAALKEPVKRIETYQNGISIITENYRVKQAIYDIGRYPDMAKFYDNKSNVKTTVTVNYKDMLENQEVVNTVKKDDISVTVMNVENDITISSEDGNNEVKAVLDAEYTGDEVTFGYDGKLMLNVLKTVENDNHVEIGIVNNIRPFYISDSSNTEYMICPIRLKNN